MSKPLTPQRTTLDYSLYAGFLFLLALVVLSALYWEERVLFADAAYQVFSVIDRQELAIQVERFGAALVQWPTLFLVHLKAPLNSVLFTYSITFTLYPLILMLLIWKVLKEKELALLVVLFFLLSQVHTFFWIQSELIQGCMYGILVMALILKTYSAKTWMTLLLWQLLIVLIVYAHPLSVAPFLYLWAWYAWEKRDKIDWRYWTVPLSVVLVLIYKYFLAEVGNYDQKAIGMTSGFGERLLDFFALDSTAFFFKRLLSTYYVLGAVFVLTVATLVRHRHWITLGLMLAGTLSWLVLVLTTYHAVTDQFYVESYYLPLGIFVGLPFIYYGLSKLSVRTGLVVLLVFSVGRVLQITEARAIYTQRLQWLTTTMNEAAEYPEQRFYLLRKETPKHITKLDWAVAYETLLLTSLDKPENAKTLYIADDDGTRDFVTSQDQFPTGIGDYPTTWLNDTYFILRDTLPVRHLLTE